jgi:hypothetical protein
LDEFKDKELEGCTFKPELLTYKGSDKKRTMEEFLGD